jgi:hypothetical protein
VAAAAAEAETVAGALLCLLQSLDKTGEDSAASLTEMMNFIDELPRDIDSCMGKSHGVGFGEI